MNRRHSTTPAPLTQLPSPAAERTPSSPTAAVSQEEQREALAAAPHDHDHDHSYLEGLEHAAESNPLGKIADAAPRQEGTQRRVVCGVVLEGTDVSPTAMDAAERIISALVGTEDVEKRLKKARTRVVIIPSDKKLTELADFAHLSGERMRGDTWDGKPRYWDDSRGSGGQKVGRDFVVSMPEENLVEVAGATDAYGDDHSIGLHEFAHTIQNRGLSKDQRKRVEELYAARQGDTSDYVSTYAASHVEEYFAESSQAFFSVNGALEDDQNFLQTRDPEMYAFLVSIYGEPEAALARADGKTPEPRVS